MNRIQKKCLVGSVILHVVLAFTLIFGAAFISHEPAAAPVLVVVPDTDHITDDATHGGDRTAQPPPPVADPKPPQPQPPPVVQQPPPPKPEPIKEIVKPEPPKIAKVDPAGVEPKPKKTPQISTNIIRGAKSPVKIASNKSSDSLDKQRTDFRRRVLNQTIKGISSGVSPATTVDTDPGPGDGGALTANYRDLVGSIYQSTWDPPNNPATDSAIVKASVTIASDGRVISARITEPSGDAEVDASVKRTLDQVTFIEPFPKSSTDKQRTYPIKFDLKAKRLT